MKMYRRHYRSARPTPRGITVKYAGKCIDCGAEIKAGETAMYYPPGTIAGVSEGKIKHYPNAWDEGERVSLKCFAELKARHEQTAVNDFAGDGLDDRYEDQCRLACGL